MDSSTAGTTDRPGDEVVLDVSGPVRVVDHGGPDGARVVLALHGLGGSAGNWDLVAPLLADEVRLVAVDLPAHGGSRPGSGSALGDAQRVVSAVADWARADAPVAVVAHSFGATVALRWAGLAPQEVSRLVLLDPPLPRGPRYDPAIALKQLLLRLPGVARAVARRQAALSPDELVAQQVRQATPLPEQVPPAVLAAGAADVARCRAAGWEAQAQAQQWRMILETMTLLRRGRSYARTFAALDLPGGWVHGELDPLSRLPSARRLAGLQPRWPFHVVPGAGHLPHVERPREVAALLATLLA